MLATLLAGAFSGSASALVPDDPVFPSQYALTRIAAPAAWDLTTGSPSVVVAVVDDGVDMGFTELSANLVPGYDFGNGDNDPSQVPADSDHGTQTASIIAARGNNAVGMAGVSWLVSLMPLKVRRDGPGGPPGRLEQIPPEAVASAFRHAGSQGARVANASFGLSSFTTPSEESAVLAAIRSSPNTLFVVSAGNLRQDNDASPRYPCSSDAPNLLCVAATDANDALWTESNFGATSVDLAAPGAGVQVTTRWTNEPISGTSYAAPHVSGAAALYFARYPAATVSDARRALLASVDPLPGLTGRTVSGGRLNVARALSIPPGPSAEPTNPPGTTPTGAPAVNPTPSSGTTAVQRARLRLRVAGGQRLREALRRGVRVALQTRSSTTVTATVRISQTTARRLRIGRVVGSVTVKLRPGLRHVRVKLRAKAVRRLRSARSVRVEVAARSVSKASNRSADGVQRRVTVLR